MTWPNRLRVAIGLVLVLAVVAAFTIVLNRRITQVSSASASIAALEVQVGTDYAGTVVEQFVQEGDTVTAGDAIVSVQSQALAHDLAIGLVRADAAPFSVETDGTMTFVAPESGIVTDLVADQGAFVQAGAVLATVEREDSLYVSAEFSLDPTDYERIETGATVTVVLPDQQEIVGTVDRIDVRTTAGRAESMIRVTSDELVRGNSNGLMMPGAPVVASVELRDDGIMAGLEESATAFLRKIGV
ncbi:HlyD family efflux transporter periplasmic adaptor subunit [Sanguibacter suaedae]|uniref:HlyD family efflux transporter periplasmic adaptor subunit n=1 Tax=Sanguibacter suaedae TaxID=2795737 RepID=A0A934I7G9_9MICO|nr:HlyD family efflux transporter periplasmic adaptor subunit [Sanguibacter suaedae]MBI9113392.1 HlyD family efflux transporter periplasmic adaptor subunit [Sanguibacter suaedae]